MPNTGGSLQLTYSFTPQPNPIRASANSANPNTTNLEVVVSNPQVTPVSIQQVAIAIPIGPNAAGNLSASLPAPTYDSSSGWTITTAGGTTTIQPRSGEPGL